MTLEVYQKIFDKRSGLIKPGLERMRLALSHLGEVEIPCKVLVGGTNGKGSTSGFLWSLLSESHTCGLYTSPHLISFTERYVISGRQTTDDDVLTVIASIKDKLPDQVYEDLSFFEVSTLIAVEMFNRHRLELSIFEVGLGGRLDATNCLDPEVSIITSIGLDHQEYLGSSISSIAKEKAGILRHRKPIFVGNLGSSAAWETILDEIERVSAIPYLFGADFGWDEKGVWVKQLGAVVRPLPYWPEVLSDAPDYQRDNFALAFSVYWYLCSRQEFRFGSMANRVLASLSLPYCLQGRFTFRDYNGRRLLLDVCHNEDGVKRFSQEVKKRFGKPIPGIVTILKDKDVERLLCLFRGILDPIVLFKVNNARSLSYKDIANPHEWGAIEPDFASALRRMEVEVAEGDSTWAICGSVFGVGEAIDFLDSPSDN